MMTWYFLKFTTLTSGGSSVLPVVTLPLPLLTPLRLLKPLAPHFLSSFSADDLVSCILKMKAIRRKLLHVSLHLCPYSLHFLLHYDLHLHSQSLFLFSCLGHCIASAIIPVSCQPGSCIFRVSHFYSIISVRIEIC